MCENVSVLQLLFLFIIIIIYIYNITSRVKKNHINGEELHVSPSWSEYPPYYYCYLSYCLLEIVRDENDTHVVMKTRVEEFRENVIVYHYLR